MVTRKGSPAKQRALARLLKEHREAAGLKLVDLEDRVGISKSTLSRFENRSQLPTDRDVAVILGALGVRGDERDLIIDLAVEANRPNWSAVGDLSEQLATMMDYEQEATSVKTVSMAYFPGLLQTREYATAVFEGGGVDPVSIPRRVSTRMQRQKILTRDEPAALLAIIDEPVLRRPVGGPAVSMAQLRHVARMAELPHITVQVIPFAVGAHPGLAGSYIHFEFADMPDVAHSESSFGGNFAEEEPELAEVITKTTKLREIALSPTDSAGLIGEAIAYMEGM